MIRYRTLIPTLIGFFLCGFLLAEAFGVPWLSGTPPMASHARPLAAVIGIVLLVADAALPVPSSVVMVAFGGLFGLAGGAALALAGRVGATLAGFACGRLLNTRLAQPDGAAGALLRRWGAFGIVLSRPLPMVAETVSVLAGASAMSWRKVTAAAVAGAVPEAVLYAWAGASGAAIGALLWLAVLAVACGAWLIGWAVERRVSAANDAAR